MPRDSEEYLAAAWVGLSETWPLPVRRCLSSFDGWALALRQAIWRKGDAHWSVCGIPEAFYTDHGSDFTSRHLEQVAADLHMALVFSIAGKPRGRGKVERIFESVNQRFLCHQPGYSPPGSPPAKPVLTLPELDARLRTFLVEGYNQRAHSETRVAPQTR